MVPKHVRRSIADVATALPHGVLQRRVSVVSEPEQVFSTAAPTLEEVRWGGGRGRGVAAKLARDVSQLGLFTRISGRCGCREGV